MAQQPIAAFENGHQRYLADSCAPLRAADARGSIELQAYGRGSYPGTPIQPDVLPGLVSVGRWEAAVDQDWGLDWHRNEGIEFTCVTSGEMSFSCEGKDFTLTPGDLAIARPWQLHRIGRPEVTAGSLTWFIIDVGIRRPNQSWNWPQWLPFGPSELRRLTDLLSHNEQPVWRCNKRVTEAVNALESALQGKASHPLTRIAVAATEVLVELSDMLAEGVPHLDPYLSSTERTVRWFLEHLGERLDETWTVERMASECGIGRTRFVHYSKQFLNISPLDVLTRLRLKEAARLLHQTDLRVTDIAPQCGFQSSQYFATVFRRHFHQTPIEFRLASSADM